jgi:hypothetical protein
LNTELPSQTKQCTKCKQIKPFAEFSKCKKVKSNLNHCCKSCNREYRELNNARIVAHRKEWYIQNREEIKQKSRDWYKRNAKRAYLKKRENCKKNPEKVKAYHKEYGKKYNIKNKERIAARRKRYCELNKEKIALGQKNRGKIYRQNPTVQAKRRSYEQLRRAKKRFLANNEFFVDHDIFNRDGWICGLCGKKINKSAKHPHPKSASLDHIIPLSMGGTHTVNNVQCAHLKCNLSKSKKKRGQLLLNLSYELNKAGFNKEENEK